MPDPRQLITNQYAIDLNQHYINKRSVLITDAIGKDDANAVWFPLEALENYLAYVKTEAAAKGFDADGIRVYFGLYPEDSSLGEKSGMTTVFLSPTGQHSGNPAAAQPSMSADINEIQPMNYGGFGYPPIIAYPHH